MAATRIRFSASAVNDLMEIRNWYSSQDAPEAGERMLAEVFQQIERLSMFPKSGRVVPEFGVDFLREIIHPPFRIVYRIDNNLVRIVRVWRSERLLGGNPDH